MKKKAFKEILKYVRVIVFFAVITILVEAVNYVMVQPGYARYIIHTVDQRNGGIYNEISTIRRQSCY